MIIEDPVENIVPPVAEEAAPVTEETAPNQSFTPAVVAAEEPEAAEPIQFPSVRVGSTFESRQMDQTFGEVRPSLDEKMQFIRAPANQDWMERTGVIGAQREGAMTEFGQALAGSLVETLRAYAQTGAELGLVSPRRVQAIEDWQSVNQQLQVYEGAKPFNSWAGFMGTAGQGLGTMVPTIAVGAIFGKMGALATGSARAAQVLARTGTAISIQSQFLGDDIKFFRDEVQLSGTQAMTMGMLTSTAKTALNMVFGVERRITDVTANGMVLNALKRAGQNAALRDSIASTSRAAVIAKITGNARPYFRTLKDLGLNVAGESFTEVGELFVDDMVRNHFIDKPFSSFEEYFDTALAVIPATLMLGAFGSYRQHRNQQMIDDLLKPMTNEEMAIATRSYSQEAMQDFTVKVNGLRDEIFKVMQQTSPADARNQANAATEVLSAFAVKSALKLDRHDGKRVSPAEYIEGFRVAVARMQLDPAQVAAIGGMPSAQAFDKLVEMGIIDEVDRVRKNSDAEDASFVRRTIEEELQIVLDPMFEARDEQAMSAWWQTRTPEAPLEAPAPVEGEAPAAPAAAPAEAARPLPIAIVPDQEVSLRRVEANPTPAPMDNSVILPPAGTISPEMKRRAVTNPMIFKAGEDYYALRRLDNGTYGLVPTQALTAEEEVARREEQKKRMMERKEADRKIRVTTTDAGATVGEPQAASARDVQHYQGRVFAPDGTMVEDATARNAAEIANLNKANEEAKAKSAIDDEAKPTSINDLSLLPELLGLSDEEVRQQMAGEREETIQRLLDKLEGIRQVRKFERRAAMQGPAQQRRPVDRPAIRAQLKSLSEIPSIEEGGQMFLPGMDRPAMMMETQQPIEPQEPIVVPPRQEVQKQAKALGLPAVGETAEMFSLVNIANKPASEWTVEEFRKILPRLSIQQVMGEGKDVEQIISSIQEQGINRGQADSLENMVTGRAWTWGRGMSGDAVIVISGSIKYDSPTSAFIKSSGKPVAIIRNSPSINAGDFNGFYKAITGKDAVETRPAMMLAVSPEQDAEYMAAVGVGDIEAAVGAIEGVLPIKLNDTQRSWLWVQLRQGLLLSAGDSTTPVGKSPWASSTSRLAGKRRASIDALKAAINAYDSNFESAGLFDDQGNVIPLSQRFQPTSPDIRFMAEPVQPMVAGKKQVKGIYFASNQTAVFFEGADAVTVLHEYFHHVQASGLVPTALQNALNKSFGDIDDPAMREEREAEAFTRYLTEGVLPVGADPKLAQAFDYLKRTADAFYGKATQRWKLPDATKQELDRLFTGADYDFQHEAVAEATLSSLEADKAVNMMAIQREPTKMGFHIAKNNFARNAGISEDQVRQILQQSGMKGYIIAKDDPTGNQESDMTYDELAEATEFLAQKNTSLRQEQRLSKKREESVRKWGGEEETANTQAILDHLATMPDNPTDRQDYEGGAGFVKKMSGHIKRAMKFGLSKVSTYWNVAKMLDGGQEDGPFQRLVATRLTDGENLKAEAMERVEKVIQQTYEKVGGKGAIAQPADLTQLIKVGGINLHAAKVASIYIISEGGNADSKWGKALSERNEEVTADVIRDTAKYVNSAEGKLLKNYVEVVRAVMKSIQPELDQTAKDIGLEGVGNLGDWYLPFISEEGFKAQTEWDDLLSSISPLGAQQGARGVRRPAQIQSRADLANIGDEQTRLALLQSMGRLNLNIDEILSRYVESSANYIGKARNVKLMTRVMENPLIAQGVARKQNTEWLDALKQIVRREMYPGGRETRMTTGERTLQYVRNYSTLSMLGYRITSGLRQFPSIGVGWAAFVTRPQDVIRSLGVAYRAMTHGNGIDKLTKTFAREPLKGMPEYEEMIKDHPSLKYRSFEPEHRDMARTGIGVVDTTGPINLQSKGGFKKFVKHSMDHIRFIDTVVVSSVYKSAKEHQLEILQDAVARGDMTPEQANRKAADFALRAVDKTQNPSNLTQRTLLQTENEFVKALNPFSGQRFINLNYYIYDVIMPLMRDVRAAEGGIAKTGVAIAGMWNHKKQLAFAWVVPALMFGMIARRRLPEDEEEIFIDLMMYPFSSLPIAGSLLQSYVSGKYQDYAYDPTMIGAMARATQRTFDTVLKATGIRKGSVNWSDANEIRRLAAVITRTPEYPTQVLQNFIREVGWEGKEEGNVMLRIFQMKVEPSKPQPMFEEE